MGPAAAGNRLQLHRLCSVAAVCCLAALLSLPVAPVLLRSRRHISSVRDSSSSLVTPPRDATGPLQQQQQQQPAPAACNCSSSSSSSSSSCAPSAPPACVPGSLPGTWVSDAPPGARWQLLANPGGCRLHNLVEAYRQAALLAADQPPLPASSSSSSSSSAAAALGLQHGSGGDGAAAAAAANAGRRAAAAPEQLQQVLMPPPAADAAPPPQLRVLMLSDSVDRYILEHLCAHLGGTKHTTALPSSDGAADQPQDATASTSTSTSTTTSSTTSDAVHSSSSSSSSSDVSLGGAPGQRRRRTLGDGLLPPLPLPAAAAVDDDGEDDVTADDRPPTSRRRRRRLHQQQQQQQQQSQQQQQQSVGASSGRGAPLSRTAYAFHACHSAAPLKLASSYFPGVHPTGPYHRGVTQDYQQRMAASAELWRAYSPGAPPHALVLSSCLWDVARLHRAEPGAVAGPELSAALLESWAANFSRVAEHARRVFPEARVWLTHTTLPPRHDPSTGAMAKPYLGNAHHIAQLNAALRAAAAGPARLQLLDYVPLGDRWAAGQGYLVDLIHPNAAVGLEAANLMLNAVALGLSEQAPQEQQLP